MAEDKIELLAYSKKQPKQPDKYYVVRLREAGITIYCQSADEFFVHDSVIIEADRGYDYGEITHIIFSLPHDINPAPEIKTVVRKRLPQDQKQIDDNKQAAKDALKMCSRKVKEYKLEMKLVDAEYSFDRKKIVFYFTAQDRIDFRELVKDLAKVFKVRIEMRQIGVRDETRLFGGVGTCGQSLCCVRFLKNFEPVSMKMAKIQKLSLNSGKISGICGRLMCCLSYEHKCYRELSKGLPREGQIITNQAGVKGKVLSVNPLKRAYVLEYEDGHTEKISLAQTPE